jgi:uncharacterized protein YcbK (DUF882 family)
VRKWSVFLSIFVCNFAFAEGRFIYEGDGCLFMKNDKTKAIFNGCYRKSDGSYDQEILKKLNLFFMVPKELNESFSLRTLSFLDYLQDTYVPNPKTKIKITSSYRSPAYNQKLRTKGSLAGKTSYHMEAMAVDVVFPGVKSEDVWSYAKSLNYGGMGYYRNKTLHVDSGKPRSWVPETAIEPDSMPPLNKNIYMSVDKDIYYPDETVQMFFSGVSDYPFGIKSKMELWSENKKISVVVPVFLRSVKSDCMILKNRSDVRKISWKIPETFSNSGKIHFKVEFCAPIFANQPAEVDSREFEIKSMVKNPV